MNTEKWLTVSNKSEKVANIKIHGVIGGGWFDEGVTSQEVDADLEEIKNLKADTIIVDLDSGGGSVLHGLKIHNLLKENPAKIQVKGTGIVASIATVIAASADEGEFSMVNNAFYLIHEARVGSGGTKEQIAADIAMLDKINDTIADIYSDKFGISREEALAIMSINSGEGEFLKADEAKELGYVDSVYKPTKGAVASITQEEINNYKIKAQLNMSEVKKEAEEVKETEISVENKAFDLGDVTNKIIEMVKNKLNSDDEEVVEEVIEEKEEVNVEEVVNEIVAKELTDVTAELDKVKAELAASKVVATEDKGSDAKLEGEAIVEKTVMDEAAEAFVNSMSVSDKFAFEANVKEEK